MRARISQAAGDAASVLSQAVSRRVVEELAEAVAEKSLLTYASAIAFRGLVALVPLTLLGLGLLGALGLKDVWTSTLAPGIKDHVTHAVYRAIDDSVHRILSSGTLALIAFASALALWHLTAAVMTISVALDDIHDVEDDRPLWRRVLVCGALGVVTAVALIGNTLAVTLAPRVAEGGLGIALGLGRWALAVVVLGAVVGLLVRYAPAEHPEVRWASAGSVLVILTWIVASIAFRWWVTSVANFKTATGTLALLLVLTAYLFVSTAIFLVGVQLDELLRKEQGGRQK